MKMGEDFLHLLFFQALNFIPFHFSLDVASEN